MTHGDLKTWKLCEIIAPSYLIHTDIDIKQLAFVSLIVTVNLESLACPIVEGRANRLRVLFHLSVRVIHAFVYHMICVFTIPHSKRYHNITGRFTYLCWGWTMMWSVCLLLVAIIYTCYLLTRTRALTILRVRWGRQIMIRKGRVLLKYKIKINHEALSAIFEHLQ